MSPGKATAGITVVNSALGFLSSDFYSSLDSDWSQSCVLPPEWGCARELAQRPRPVPEEGPESGGDGGTRWQVDLACRGGTGRALPRAAPPPSHHGPNVLSSRKPSRPHRCCAPGGSDVLEAVSRDSCVSVTWAAAVKPGLSGGLFLLPPGFTPFLEMFF